jgi:hypothetical protein
MLGLALGADEEDIFARGDGLSDEALGQEEALHGFAHIDQVDHVALAVDVGGHLRIPARDAMPEVDSGVHERFDDFCLLLLLSHASEFRLRLCNLRLKGKMASVLFSRKSASANRKPFPSSARRDTGGQEAGTAWGLVNENEVLKRPDAGNVPEKGKACARLALGEPSPGL